MFIPPGQPWRTGTLERFPWSMESEYFREERPATVPAALAGLTDWLNDHNRDRPHSRLRYAAPADTCPWARPLPPGFWELGDLPDPPERCAGTVEAVRMVYVDGRVDTWGQVIRLSPALAGQFVRVVFSVTGETSEGAVVWQARKGVDLPVACFRHTLDARGLVGRGWTRSHGVELLEFAEDPPPNQGLDMEQLENQMSRTLKRRVDLGSADGP